MVLKDNLVGLDSLQEIVEITIINRVSTFFIKQNNDIYLLLEYLKKVHDY